MREAQASTTNWIEPDDGARGARCSAYARALYDHAPFRDDFEPFAERVAAAGELHALRQTALKLTVPGVPDVYQGDELRRPLARRPRQPPPGRLGAPPRAARASCATAPLPGAATRASCG